MKSTTGKALKLSPPREAPMMEIMDEMTSHESSCRVCVGRVKDRFSSDINVELKVYSPAASEAQAAFVAFQFYRFEWKETVEESSTDSERAHLSLRVLELPAIVAGLQRVIELAQREGAIPSDLQLLTGTAG